MVDPTPAPLPMVGSHRMLFQTTGPTLQDAEQDDAIEVASFIDRRDAGGDNDADTVEDKDSDPDDKENRDVFPNTFAGFLAYFVAEVRQPTKAFADTGEEIKTATSAAPSMEGRTA
nr:hypothetical protein B0A51_05574 [Rachicladosporium sp. CCFEE 5018]